MKKLLPILLLTIATTAGAQRPATAVCTDLQELSHKIMELRQTGTPASQVIALADNNRVVHAIIIAAYEEPQYNTALNQSRASREFASRVFIECFKSTQKWTNY